MNAQSEEEDMEPSTSTPSHFHDRRGKLFAGGLPVETTEEKLTEHFKKYGELLEVAVMRDRATGRPRGFGFITYKDPTNADTAVQDVHIIDGRQIDVKKSVPQEHKAKARKIFVGGLAPDTTEDNLKQHFSEYGVVSEVQIMQDHMSGRSRGFGFVTFDEDSAAEKVFNSGSMHEIGGKRVEIKPATPKGSGAQGMSGGGGGPVLVGGPGSMRGGQQGMEYAYVNPMATTPYGYGMYGYAPPRAGLMQNAPYGMQYSAVPSQPYMMLQPTIPGQYPTSYGGGPTQGGILAAQTYSTSPGSQMMMQRGSPTSPYHPGAGRNKAGGAGGRGKVDSASSLDQHAAQQFQKLHLG